MTPNERMKKIRANPELQKSVNLAREMLHTKYEEDDMNATEIDQERVVDLLGKLMDVEDEIDQCDGCFSGGMYCSKHSLQEGELKSELRKAMGRK